MKLTTEAIAAAVGSSADRAELFADHLAGACAYYGIDTLDRLAAFLAQIGHESGGLRYVREIASGEAYEGRKDLGNTEPGDGQRYRGRGLIQTTGRDNYRRVRDRLQARLDAAPDFEATPEALEMPKWAAWSAADYWDMRGLNALADRGDFEAITRKINGGLNGQADRLKRWEKAKAVLTLLDDQSHRFTPAGEAGPQEHEPMAPFLAAVLPSIVSAVPKLIETFGSGSEVSQRNQKAAEMVATIAKDALGAVNEQEVAARLKTDPEAPAIVRKAIEARWFEVQEAGGGGIEGARKADAAVSGGDILKSPSFWVAILLLPLVYLLVMSLIGLIGTAQWSDDVRAGLAGSLISAIIGGLVGYYYGQTTSRNRTEAAK